MLESVLCKIYKKKVVTLGDILADVLQVLIASFIIGSMIFTLLAVFGLIGLQSDISMMHESLQFIIIAVFVIGLLCLVLLCLYLISYTFTKISDLIYYICNIKVATCSIEKKEEKE